MTEISAHSIINAMWDDNHMDVTAEVNFIWSIANKLRGPYKSDKYKDVIIPMTIIRRFECALAKNKEKVVEQYEKNKNFPAKALCSLSGYQFYNTSRYDLTELCNDPYNLRENFTAYIEGFSSNVQDIISKLEFEKQLDKLDSTNRLYSVAKAFSELDLDPDTIDSMKMGYIFEELIRKFSENAAAGDHYTGRDIIKLMVALILSEGSEDIAEPGKVVTVLDQACGTGGMLSTSYNCIRQFNPSADVRLFGHEVNSESYAMCVAEMLIKGQNVENIRYQDTMIADAFPSRKMRFVIENPPFGEPWGGKDAGEGVEAAVRAEYLNPDSRWPAGLPGTGDMQMLFLQSAVDKMDEHLGRAAIIEDGSPLFVGGTASGESQIRRWLLEQDLIEAIVAMPTDLFYNTGIATYIWLLSKNKRQERRGKVQLIDATSFCHKRRKALGNKRNEFSREDCLQIVQLYTDFSENEHSKIFPNTEFLYREYAVYQPLQRSYAINEERIELLKQSGKLNYLYNEAKVAELEAKEELTDKEQKQLEEYESNEYRYRKLLLRLSTWDDDIVYPNKESFMSKLFLCLNPVVEIEESEESKNDCPIKIEDFITDKKQLDAIADGLSKMDKLADIVYDKKGNIVYDKETKDTEIVRYDEDIDTYMAREVLPHVPDAKAFFEEDLSKKKPIIKTGAEIPFTRYYYKYQAPTESHQLAQEFIALEQSVAERINKLFGE